MDPDDITHPRTAANAFSRIFLIFLLAVLFIGGGRIIYKYTKEVTDSVVHDDAWAAVTRAEIAAIDSEINEISDAQRTNNRIRDREWVHHEATAVAADDLNKAMIKALERRASLVQAITEYEVRKLHPR
jgi:hypothetical protein